MNGTENGKRTEKTKTTPTQKKEFQEQAENSNNKQGAEKPLLNLMNMCIYETKLKNMRYMPTIKNKGNVPKITDYRQLYIKIGCGWCKECRKKIANDWRIRLTEELKTNKEAEFITLSFSPESIKKLRDEIIEKKYKGINGTEIDVNIVAAYSLRMFSERWRKKYKKNPRYWFITELGHTNSERLHLHGIMFRIENTTKKQYQKDIIEKWQYGNIWIGEWVDIRTINYINKYVTKIDKKHKGYKQKIFTSKGIGKDYINRNGKIHEFREDNTITTYKNNNGTINALPRYYKEKLWNDEEREKIWSKQMDKEETYINGIKYKISENEEEIKKFENVLDITRETNKNVGYGDNTTKNMKYIITDAMMKNYDDLRKLDKDKLVNKVERRVKKEYNYEKKEIFSKEIDGKIEIETYYIGTTTESERKRNNERSEAEEMGISIRELRLRKAGII